MIFAKQMPTNCTFSHDLIYIFLKGIYSWPVAHGNKCSSLIMRDIQTSNTTVRYYFILMRLTYIKIRTITSVEEHME